MSRGFEHLNAELMMGLYFLPDLGSNLRAIFRVRERFLRPVLDAACLGYRKRKIWV